jgi:hydroxymethylpyrimidine pyrophosphatase-like HAD family hydrolase
MERPKTIISDIDGTLFKHNGDICSQHLGTPVLLPGVKESFQNWDRNGYHIILVTGRRESVREDTERQLSEAGIFYDALVMGVGGGVRVLVNDRKVNSNEDMAICVNLLRNDGIESLKDI